MTPQIDNQIDNTTTTVTLPSKTYKLNVTDEDKKLADGIKIVEYIEPKNGNYVSPINIDLAFTDSTTVEIEFALNEINTNKIFIGYSNSTGGMATLLWHVYVYNSNGQYEHSYYRGTPRPGRTITLTEQLNTANTQKHKIKIVNALSYYFDGVLNENIEFLNRGVLYPVFGKKTFHSATSTTYEYGPSAKLYSIKVYDTNTNQLLREILPAINVDGRVGLYDTVNDTFYTGIIYNDLYDFTAGPLIRTIYKDTRVVDAYKFTDSISGYTDNLEAMKQAIYHILMTERYSYIIYSDNYGVEFEQYIGAEFDYLQSTIQSTLKDALMYDLRIKDVKVDEVTKVSTDIAHVKFTAYTIYGDLQLEVNINV